MRVGYPQPSAAGGAGASPVVFFQFFCFVIFIFSKLGCVRDYTVGVVRCDGGWYYRVWCVEFNFELFKSKQGGLPASFLSA